MLAFLMGLMCWAAQARWEQREVSVWIAPAPVVADTSWQPINIQHAHEAFELWESLTPVHFRFVEQVRDADIRVDWITKFDHPITGINYRAVGSDSAIKRDQIFLALHRMDGRPLSEIEIAVTAIHEVGHAMGLNHSTDPWSMMAPQIRTASLTPLDSVSVKLLYAPRPVWGQVLTLFRCRW